MSISSEITRISGNVSDALNAIRNKGVTVPSGANSDDLATLIGAIQTGGGTPSATSHTILFEFTDETSVTITAYYDDTFISDAIRATTPAEYGNKIVQQASLDSVVWYQRPTEVWETVYDESDKAPNVDTPYNYFWLGEQDLGDIYPTIGSVWRITINNNEYVCTAVFLASINRIVIGNPKYSGGSDDGSAAPFCFYNAGWGAWVGDTELAIVGCTVKIERQVTT